MHFALIPEHLNFFHTHHYVEFDDLISEDDAKILSEATKQTLAHRLKKTHTSLLKADLCDLFLAGRDIWRENETVKRMTLRSHLAEIASQLSKLPQLRIAYDQVLLSAPLPISQHKQATLPPSFLSPLPLETSSSIQGVASALILQLSPTEELQPPSANSDEPTSLIPLPKKMGNGIFFQPTFPLSLAHLATERLRTHQLLIVYCREKSIYKWEKNDPHTHAFKKLGYVFGDRLTQKTHPTLLH